MALANESIPERFNTATFAAGRMFYMVNNILYYSQVMEGSNISFLTKCYQKNDPTADILSDLLDTDGGTIPISEASKGLKLINSKTGVIILCDNGVWEISGPDSGFKATEFKLDKVTSNGCISAESVVKVGDKIFYWGPQHIHVLAENEFGILKELSLTETTIKSLYKDIALVSKKKSHGFYNSVSNEVEWFYSSLKTETITDLLQSHDRGLNLSLKGGGFFPMEYKAKTTASTTAGTSIVGGVDLSSFRDDGILYINASHATVGAGYTTIINTGRKNVAAFQDFGFTYSTAFIETGPETLDKPSNVKTAPYVMTHFTQTEKNYIDDQNGSVELDNQSGCKMSSIWDWNDSDANSKFGPPQQVYRFARQHIPDGIGPFNSGNTVISVKTSVRGSGKALSLRFEQETGKDMQLLGWTISWSMKGKM